MDKVLAGAILLTALNLFIIGWGLYNLYSFENRIFQLQQRIGWIEYQAQYNTKFQGQLNETFIREIKQLKEVGHGQRNDEEDGI